jgi:hypothetical protein
MEPVRRLKPPRIRHYQTRPRPHSVYDSLPGARECRRKFLRFFPQGFQDETYLAWERDYKWQAHVEWQTQLHLDEYRRLLKARRYGDIAARAVKIEARTNLLFSFEKMALRDAVREPHGARLFAIELYELLHGPEDDKASFERWHEAVGRLPRKQTRVLTWPVVTVMGFIAQPAKHIFLKPTVNRAGAREYGYDFQYRSRPSWETYKSLLDFAAVIRRDLRDLAPRDMIDLQSYIWVQGSDEYEE